MTLVIFFVFPFKGYYFISTIKPHSSDFFCRGNCFLSILRPAVGSREEFHNTEPNQASMIKLFVRIVNGRKSFKCLACWDELS